MSCRAVVCLVSSFLDAVQLEAELGELLLGFALLGVHVAGERHVELADYAAECCLELCECDLVPLAEIIVCTLEW